VIAETTSRVSALRIKSVEDVRALGEPLVAFSEPMHEKIAALKKFLTTHMYRHYRVNRMTSKARRVLRELFGYFLSEPNCLPPEWQKQAAAPGSKQTAEIVADFIAGMTDRFAIDEFERAFNPREKS
jgi:dGTPase